MTTSYVPFFIILLGAILVRVLTLPSLPPPLYIDEAFMAQSALAILDQTRSLLDTSYSITIIGNAPTAFFIKFLGLNVVSLRLSAVLLGLATNIFLYFLIKDTFNRKVALITFFVACFSHVAIAYSRINLPNIQAPFFLVTSIYFLHVAIKKNHWLPYFITGLLCGTSFYSYTGAKIIIFLVALYALINRKKIRRRAAKFLILGFVAITLPLLSYIQHSSSYLQREQEVLLISKPQSFYAKYDTHNLISIFYQQFLKNLRGFSNLDDGSTQYGNASMLDMLSSYFFFIYLIVFYPLFLKIKKNKVQDTHYYVIVFFLTLLFVSLTDSPPLSTRLLILYPIVAVLIGLGISASAELVKRKKLRKIFIFAVLLCIGLSNLKIYFYDYTANRNAYYRWIEPASSIGFYTRAQPDSDIGLLSNPHTYSTESILEVLNHGMKKNIINLTSMADFRQFTSTHHSWLVIVPLAPVDAIGPSTQTRRKILQEAKTKKYRSTIHWGISCKECHTQPIFISIKGTS